MKYNLSQIMKKAWELFRKGKVTFAEALHRAWLSAKAVTINQKRIEDAKAAAGVEEETNTWSEWKKKRLRSSTREQGSVWCNVDLGKPWRRRNL